jgi:transposase-like protein
MYTGTDIIDFFNQFSNEKICLKYLSDQKWNTGYACIKCNNKSWSKTAKPYVRKCNKCKYKESATANTLFHKIKFPLPKAFYIVFMMSTSKKSLSSLEFSRKLSLHKRTCSLFQHKIREVMGVNELPKISTTAVVDEFMVGGPEENKKGRSNGKKTQAVMLIESNNYGILRCHAQTINNAGTKELKPIIKQYVCTKAIVKTDRWRGYTPIKKEYPNLIQEKSANGKNFPLIHRQIMMFKGWLRGVHHHCKHLQSYLNEYCFRFNYHKEIKNLFHLLIVRMVNSNPLPLSSLKICWGL